MNQIVIVGAGGFGREVKMLIDEVNRFSETPMRVLGFIDERKDHEEENVRKMDILGNDDWALQHLPNSTRFICTIAQPNLRKRIVTQYHQKNWRSLQLFHPNVMKHESLIAGEGSIVCAGSMLTTDIHLGNHCHVNLQCTIGHDTILEDFVTLYPGVRLSGFVYVEEGVEIGTGAIVLPGLRLGKGCIIGAGAVVRENCEAGKTYVGIPARPIER